MLADPAFVGAHANGKPYVKFDGDILPAGHSAALSAPGQHRWFLQVDFRQHKGGWQIDRISKKAPDDLGILTLDRARDNDGEKWEVREKLVSLGSTSTSSSASILGTRMQRSASVESNPRPTTRSRMTTESVTGEITLQELMLDIPPEFAGSIDSAGDTSGIPSAGIQTTTANFLHGGTSLTGCAVPLPSNDTVLSNLKHDLKNAIPNKVRTPVNRLKVKGAVAHATQLVQNLAGHSIAAMVLDNTLTNAAEAYLLQNAGEQAQKPMANRNIKYHAAKQLLDTAVASICLHISLDHGVKTPTVTEFAKIPAGRTNSELVRSVSAELRKLSLSRTEAYIRTIEEFVSSMKGEPLHWIAAHNELSAYVSDFKIAHPELLQSFPALDRYLPSLLQKPELGVSTDALASGITRKEYRLEDDYNFDQLNIGWLAPIPSTIPKGRSNSELIRGFIVKLREKFSDDSSYVRWTIEFAESMLDGVSLNELHQTESLKALVKIFMEEKGDTMTACTFKKMNKLLSKLLPSYLAHSRLSGKDEPT